MNVFLLIFFMMLVTYMPRMLPSLFVEKLYIGKKFRKFLELIPYTAMAALIFPGVIGVDPNMWAVGAIGALVSVAFSLINKMPLMVVVVAAVLADMAIYYLI